MAAQKSTRAGTGLWRLANELMGQRDVLQLIRFGIVGTVTALIFIVLVWLAGKVGIETPAVTVGAYLTAVTFQYLAHAKFTFNVKAADSSALKRFVAVNAFGLVFSILLVDFLAPIVLIPRPLAAFGVIATLPIINFVAFKFWAFAGKSTIPDFTSTKATMSHVYNDTFFEYIELGSFRSARRIVPIVTNALAPASVLDVGCGRGAWAKIWTEETKGNVNGVDGAYVDTNKLHIDPECFHKRDLSEPFDLDRRFDLATTLEVAEHLPTEASEAFVESLTRHADRVMFSAAPPGQGGERHINEQPLEFWRKLFAKKGYMPFDFLRPQISSDAEIEPWYRFNTILYVKAETIDTLPDAIKACQVRDGDPIKEIGPLSWQLRRAVVRLMPRAMVDWIAVANARRKAEAHASS